MELYIEEGQTKDLAVRYQCCDWYLVLPSPQGSPYNTQVPCTTPPLLSLWVIHSNCSYRNTSSTSPTSPSSASTSTFQFSFYALYLHYCVSLPFQHSHTFYLSPPLLPVTHLTHPDPSGSPQTHLITLFGLSESLPRTLCLRLPVSSDPPFSFLFTCSISPSLLLTLLFFFDLLPTAWAIPKLLFPPHPCAL